MAWTQEYVATASMVTPTNPTTYPTTNSPDFAGDGIIISIPVYSGLADGDVVVLAVRSSVGMPRDGSPFPSPTTSASGGPWTGTNKVVKFPCIPLSSAQQNLTSYGATSPLTIDGSPYTNCEQAVWLFQVTDAATHLGLVDWIVNISWDPGAAPWEWGDVDASGDTAHIVGGVTVYRSDTNPTYPIAPHSGKRGCSYISFPYTAMPSGDTVYVHVAAADGISPALADVPVSGWTESWVKEATVLGDHRAIGLQHALAGRPSNNPDWMKQDPPSGTYTGEGGGDGDGSTAGSVYVSWQEYAPSEPPVVIDEQASSCLLHIPHHRWLEGVGGSDKQTKKAYKSQTNDSPIRLVEENWHEVESWIAHFLTDDSCRPCSEYVTPPTE